MFRVAIWAKTMMPAATIHVNNIEFVTANFPIWKTVIGFNDTAGSCSPPWLDAASAASVVVASANPQSNTTTAKRKQRLRIFVSIAVAGIGDASLPR
jgi:hypothetical protein